MPESSVDVSRPRGSARAALEALVDRSRREPITGDDLEPMTAIATEIFDSEDGRLCLRPGTLVEVIQAEPEEGLWTFVVRA